MRKRVGAIEEFEFEPLVFGGGVNSKPQIEKQMHIAIAVTGWLSDGMRGENIAIAVNGWLSDGMRGDLH